LIPESLVLRQDLPNFFHIHGSFAEKSLQFNWRELSSPGFSDQDKVVQIPVEQAQSLETQAVLVDLVL